MIEAAAGDVLTLRDIAGDRGARLTRRHRVSLGREIL